MPGCSGSFGNSAISYQKPFHGAARDIGRQSARSVELAKRDIVPAFLGVGTIRPLGFDPILASRGVERECAIRGIIAGLVQNHS